MEYPSCSIVRYSKEKNNCDNASNFSKRWSYSKKKKKKLGATALIGSNKKVDEMIKIIKSLEEYFLLIKSVDGTIKNESKLQKSKFLGMLLGTLGASLLGNMLVGQGVIRIGQGAIRGGEGTNRVGQGFWMHLIL